MTKTIKSTISQRKDFADRNRQNYLILELDNGESIFVFPSKVNEERWSWLMEGKEINFTVEEGKKGNSLLVDYEIES